MGRAWSNRAAAAGNADPCQPSALPAQPYVGAAPILPDDVTYNGQSGKGVIVPLGASRTIEVDCFSFQPTAPITLSAGSSSVFSFSWDQTTCVNGDKRQLSISATPSSVNGDGPTMLEVNTEPAGGYGPNVNASTWLGVVTTH
jgi:hypothetical protein